MATLLGRHWLAALNAGVAVFLALPLVAPLFLAAGLTSLALPIYAAYRGVCHQWAFRSFFVLGPQATYPPDQLAALVGADRMHGFLGSAELGYKMAFCERDAAIYAAVLLAGLAYGLVRRPGPPLGLGWYCVLITPMAIDGFTQLFGWRESTPELRVVTGALFGAASVWLVYPRLDVVLASSLAQSVPEPLAA